MSLDSCIMELEEYIEKANEADNPDNVFSGISRALMAMAKHWKRDIPFSQNQVNFASDLLKQLQDINGKNLDENQKGLLYHSPIEMRI